MKNNSDSSFRLVFLALAVVINLVLVRINILLSFLPNPLYLDTVGTIFATRAFGLGPGLLVALVSALINQLRDPFALPYLPTNIATVVVAYIIYHKISKDLNVFVKAAMITLASAFLGGLITAYIFGGATSAGSSVILRFLHLRMGMSLVFVSFLVQFATEFIDKTVMVLLVDGIYKMLPENILARLKN